MIQQLLSRKSSYLFSLLLFIIVIEAQTAPALPEDIHKGIIAVNENIYWNNFDGAENEAKKIIRKNPDHPAGYFCMAFVIDSWMMRYQSYEKENEFYRFCDLAIEKGEKILLHNPKEEWARFFVGGTDGFKGTYEARFERWITAFRYGWKGVSVLLDLQASGCSIPDINYGIGSYNYWRSALMKLLWWMPWIEDKREEGIKQLYKARSEGLYIRTLASVALLEILINEKQYADALTIADEGLQQYPKATAFIWGKARALYGLQRYNEATVLLKEMIRTTELDDHDNHYNTSLYHFYLAKIFLAEKKYLQAIDECNVINNYTFKPSIRKRLDATFAELKNIKKQILQEMEKDR